MSMENRLVNVADWRTPDGITVPEGWVIANAPRPLLGPLHWTGPFLSGTFYAAAPADADRRSWESDGAVLVEFITDARIRELCEAKAREQYGYADLAAAEADGLGTEVWAESLQLPWRGGAAESAVRRTEAVAESYGIDTSEPEWWNK